MEADLWSRFSDASKRHQSALQSRFDLYLGYEEIDGGDEDSKAEFPCPFCSEDFDIVGLCCHIDDEHAVEAKNGSAGMISGFCSWWMIYREAWSFMPQKPPASEEAVWLSVTYCK